MRKLSLLLLTVCFATIVNAQITITVTGNTNTTPNLLATYPSLSAALTDLNAVTVMTGPVVLTCDAGTSETAPIKGFVLGSATLNPVLSATNTITINKTGGAVTINAGVGTANGPSVTPDGMLYLNGADYVTIDGLTFTDGNTLTATVAMEFGVAFFKLNAGDGCNNNTIQNCTFNMQRINNNAGSTPMLDGSWAIEVLNSTAAAATTALTPTNGGTLATNGTNSGNRFYTNTINSGNGGIGFGGYAATLGVGPAPTATTFLGDLGNDVGGTSSGTGNTILNFGGGAATSPSAGIRANNQWSVNIQYNTVNNNNGSGVNHATTLRGIYAQAGTSANATISNNIVTVQSGATTSALNAIENAIGSTAAANTININNNTIRLAYTTATTGVMSAITNSASAATVNINSNNIQGVAAANYPSTGTINLIVGGSPGGPLNITGNTISNFTLTGASGIFRGINAATPTGLYTITGNTIENFSYTLATSTGSLTGIYNLTSAATININNNIIRNFSTPTTGTLNGIQNNTVAGTFQCRNNQIYNFSTTAGGAGGFSANGITWSNANVDLSGNIIYAINSTGTTGGTGGTINGITHSGAATVTGNAIYDLSSNSTNVVITGITTAASGTNTVSNNLVGDLRAPNSTGNIAISGMLISGGTTNNIFHNTVNIASTTASATTSGTSAIYFSSSSPVNNLRNNIFVNTSTPGPTGGFTAAIRYTIAPTSTNFPAANNNNFYYAGVAAANKVLYCEGSSAAPTNGQQTIAAYKTYINTTLPVAGRESSSVSEIPNWVSTTGTNPVTTFLQYNTAIPTQMEQGGGTGTGISTDFAATTRCPGGGCPGAASTPDMGAWELNGLALDLSAPNISYTVIPNTTCLTDRTLSSAITDASGVNTTAGTKPRLYFKKSGDLNTYAGNTNADNGWKFVEATNASSPFSFTTDYTLLQSAVAPGDVIQYFVVAQDNAGTPNVGINSGIFAAAPTSVALTSGAFPLTGTINSYTVVLSVPTTITIGALGTYTTLTAASTGFFADLNAKSLSGNTTVTILDAAITETGAVPLTAINYGCGGGPYTLTIKPNTGVTTVLSGTFAGPLIDLNGADLVTFDGSNSGGSTKDMTIRNISTTGQTFRFINDATDNTIKNTIVEGANTSASSGVILFSTAATGSIGNSNNVISNCDVRDRSDAAGVPANAIYSSGTATPANANNTISTSNIFNHTNAGVLVSATGAGNGWTISGNSIYQTAARTAALTGISVQGGNGHSVLNNFIGGTAANAGSTNLATSSTFTGISLAVGTVTATSVQGNTVKNIRSTTTGFTASYGINLSAGTANIGNVSGNTVGSSNVAERFEINGDSYGIRVASTTSVNLSNNTVNNFGTNATPSTGEYYFGISVEGTGAHSVINNTVANVINASTPDASFNTQLIGMTITATGIQTIRGNTIHDVGNTSATAPTSNNNRIWGLIISGTPAGTVVEKNNIYNIYGSSTATGARADVITLLQSQSVANATYSNNMISSGTVNASSDRAIFGILDISAAPAVSNYYFNSVSITGTGTGTNSTYAFNRNSTATVDIRNNIFSNARTGGTGYHVAIANTNAAATGWAATAANYNDLYSATASTVGQWLGALAANNRDFTGWQASQGAGTPGSGGDANSWSVVPGFTTAIDLHIPAATSGPLESGGTTIFGISTDIDGQTRPGPAGSVNGGGTLPDIGVDEFDGIPATPMVYVSSTTTQNTANVGLGSSNQHVIGIQVVTNGSLSPLSATSFTIGTTGTTNLADITNAKLWYTGTSSTFATGVQFGTTLAVPVASFNITGTQVLSQGTNYFWLTYDVPCGSTVANVIDGECTSFNIGTVQSPTPTAPAGSRTIVAGTGISGIKTVGTLGDYLTLTDAAAAINTNGLSGPLTLSILNSLSEPGAVVFNAITYICGGPFPLTISPASGVTATVSGTVASGALIKLNGADYVTIDGSNNGSNSRDLTITNLSTTSPAAIWLASRVAAGADNNTIKNCIINTGSNAATSYGIAIAGATLGSGGADNDNVSIQNNNITRVYHGIWANGTASASAGGLDGLTIAANIVGPAINGATNIGFTGINIANAVNPNVTLNTVQNISATSGSAAGILTAATVAGATISQNTVQNVATTTPIIYGILAGGASGTFTISKNTVSQITASAGSSYVVGIEATVSSTIESNKVSGIINNTTGTYGAYGINLNGGNSSIVRNNFVSNVTHDMSGGTAFSTTFGMFGIRIGTGTGHQVYHNSVNLYGLMPGAATSSHLSAAFAIVSTASTGCDVRNNIFANNITGGTTSIAHVSVYLPTSGTIAMELTWNNNAYFTGTTAGSTGIAHVGTTYTATPAGPTTYAGLYTVAAFDASTTAGTANFRSYTSNLLTANTNNDNASLAFTAAVPFTSSTDLHIPAATPGQLESAGATVGLATDIDNDARPGPAGSVNGGATAPDMGADEFDGTPASPMIYVSSTTTQNTNNVGNGTTDNHIIGIQVVTSGTLSPLSATSFTINTNGTTAPATDITNAKLWYTGNSSTFATGTQFGATNAAPSGSFAITGTQTLATGTNYFWLTYDIPCTAVLTNVADAECNSLTVTIARTPTVQVPAGSRTIIAGGLSGTVTIGAAGTYPTLTGTGGLFAAINTNGLAGDLTANIIDASVTETGAIALNQITFGCAAGPYGVTIKPGAGVTATLTGAVGTSLIKLNGADNVTIDGSNNGSTSRDLTLTNTGSGSMVWIGTDGTAGATNNTLKNFNMVGPGAFTGQGIIAGSGTTFGSAAENGRPNSNNTIQNLTAKGVQNAVYAIGDSTTPDQNWLITQNQFGSAVAAEKLSFRGIALQNAQNFTISRNKIFGVISSTGSSSTMTGILVGASLNGGTITRNEISDIKQTNTFGWGSNGIYLNSTSTAANVNVLNNVIYDVASYGYDDITAVDNGYGIMVNTGGGYNIQFNSIRMTTDQTEPTGRTTAINIASGITTAASLDIRNNIFANTQTVGNRYAIISAAASTVFSNINYNDYYSAGVTGYDGVLLADIANLAAWKIFSTQDAQSVAVDPLFTSTTNLNLLPGSTLIGAGVTIVGVTNDYTNSTRNNPPSIGAYEDKVVFAAKIYLQGAYSAGLGQHRANTPQWTTATNAGALTQPYSAAPFSYTGTESVASGFFANTAGNDPMDWVLLELRDASTPTTVIAKRAAIVMEDGMIYDVDGTSPVSFRGVNGGNYFVVIRHRNHLGVRSGTTQLVDGNAITPATYDFTSAQSQALQDGAIVTNAAMAQNGSAFMMWAGNVNQDVYVRATTQTLPPPTKPSDASAILVILGGDANATGGYTAGDVNMDGYTRATTQTLPPPAKPSDAAFILSTPLSGNGNATRQEHKVNN